MALQGAAAGAASYSAARLLGLEEISWAVISALFVVQQSADDTVKKAAGRVLGAMIGTAVGLLSVAAIPGSDWTALRVALSALALTALGNVYPSLRYGVVAAAVIALDSGGGALGGALDRGQAIILGAGLGAVAALAVWPESARRRALRLSRSALEACRELLQEELSHPFDDKPPDLKPLHDRFLRHARRARESAESSRLRLPGRRSPAELVQAIVRLWHSLILLDRAVAGEQRVGLARSDRIEEAIRCVRETACSYVQGLQEQLGGGGAPPQAELDDAVEAAAKALGGSQRPQPAAYANQALLFGLRETARDLKRVAAVAGEVASRSARSSRPAFAEGAVLPSP